MKKFVKRLSLVFSIIFVIALYSFPVSAEVLHGPVSISTDYGINNDFTISAEDSFIESVAGTVIIKVNSDLVLLNGDLQELSDNGESYSIFGQSGRTFAPIRFISQCFGADVSWDNTTKVATVVSNAKTLKFTLNSKSFTSNGTKITMDVPVIGLKGHIYIPIRFISEALGKVVNYKNGVIVVGDKDIDASSYTSASYLLSDKDALTTYVHSPIIGTEVGASNNKWDMATYGNRVFFINHSQNGQGQVFESVLNENGSIDNTKVKSLNTGYYCWGLNVFNDKLYFYTYKNVQCINLKTGTLSTIIDTPVADMLVTKYGIIYSPATLGSDGLSRTNGKGLWLADFDGNNSKKIGDIPNIISFKYFSNTIYCMNDSADGTKRCITSFNILSKKTANLFSDIYYIGYYGFIGDKFYVSGYYNYSGDKKYIGTTLIMSTTDFKKRSVVNFYGDIIKNENQIYSRNIVTKNSIDYSVRLYSLDISTGSNALLFDAGMSTVVFMDTNCVYLDRHSELDKDSLGIDKVDLLSN